MSLTIKQAFAALSDACANGMKNPFFVMRRLKESFADVADKVVDASGDKVTVTPITDSGTKIAEIKVNNTTSELYAPDGGSQDYSTTEYVIGKWTDGKTLYEKVITFNYVSGQYTHVAFDSTVDKLLLIDIIPIGCSNYYVNSNDYLRAYRHTYDGNDGIMFERGSSSSTSTGDVIIRYTKVSS